MRTSRTRCRGTRGAANFDITGKPQSPALDERGCRYDLVATTTEESPDRGTLIPVKKHKVLLVASSEST
jgi:hypothetical protein